MTRNQPVSHWTTDNILARPTPAGFPLIQEPTPPLPTCQGSAIWWELRSPYQTYPFSIHDPTSHFKPGYTLLFVDPTSSRIHVRSLFCTGSSPTPAVPCLSCQATTGLVSVVLDRARRPCGKLSLTTLSHTQLGQRLGSVTKKLKKVQTTVRGVVSSDNLFLTHE